MRSSLALLSKPGKAHITFRYGKRSQAAPAGSSSQSSPAAQRDDSQAVFIRPAIPEEEIEAINSGVAHV